MHDGCTGTIGSGKQIVDKIRVMGFNTAPIPAPLTISCSGCRTDFRMAHMESACPNCRMVYGVTPCHSHDAQFVRAAGVDY